jgi:hypothetical protein
MSYLGQNLLLKMGVKIVPFCLLPTINASLLDVSDLHRYSDIADSLNISY